MGNCNAKSIITCFGIYDIYKGQCAHQALLGIERTSPMPRPTLKHAWVELFIQIIITSIFGYAQIIKRVRAEAKIKGLQAFFWVGVFKSHYVMQGDVC